ncbi:MAG: hypothetical protein J6Q19_04945, partial [Bacteroidaceae bacterium]|nr:hypothetical protein [Bacteroidaceae bacterium]
KSDEQIAAMVAEQQRKKRSTTITITYTPTNGGPEEVEVTKYQFIQRCIYPVISSKRRVDKIPYIYYIEFFEEYLHNFDSNDGFGLTDYEGMAWGLPNVQLSHSLEAYAITEGSVWEGALNTIMNWTGYDPKYDFYLSKDECAEKNNGVEGTHYFPYNGYTFTQNIINYLVGTENEIGVLPLNISPNSAIEYCYNKNKRNSDGTITTSSLNWYMPSIDELEDIISNAYLDFEVFQEKYYWSCQPAYEYLPLYYWRGSEGTANNTTGKGHLFRDDISNARATRMIYQGEGAVPEYLAAKSGVKEYDKILYISYVGFGRREHNVGTLILDDGNKARTDKCRVRAVYMPRN